MKLLGPRCNGLNYLLNDVGRGPIREEFYGVNCPSCCFDNILSNDVAHRPVGAFHKDIGHQSPDQFIGSVLIKEADVVDNPEGCQNRGPVILLNDRSVVTLQPSDGRIRVDANNQDIAECPRLREVVYVAEMENVKAPVREDD